MLTVLRVAAGSVVALCLLILAIRAQQYFFRFKAERLQEDIRGLKYGKTTFASAQPDLQRWNAEITPDRSCTQGSCFCRISFGDFAYQHSVFFAGHQRFLRVYGVLGGRPAAVIVKLAFLDRVIHDKSFSVAIEVSPHESASVGFTPIGYDLLGESSVRETLLSVPWASAHQHPRYEVGSPGGCEVCISIWVHFDGDASESDIARVGAINLSCLSRWFEPCRWKEDLMPGAWQIERNENPDARPY